MGKINKQKEITITYAEFQDIATDVAAEICMKVETPAIALVSALLLAEISERLFADDEITIEDK